MFNRQVVSSKGVIGTDQLAPQSRLHDLYHSALFQSFICDVVAQEAIYPYADPLSSINVHYAGEGKELGWHFDNSAFAITLLLQAPEAGGVFEYVKDVRDADAGDYNFEAVEAILDGAAPVTSLAITPGTLVLFAGVMRCTGSRQPLVNGTGCLSFWPIMKRRILPYLKVRV